MKSKQYFLRFIFLNIFFSMVLACESVEKDIELPLPEIYLTSTLTDINQTKVKIKGERTGIRNNDTDVFGVVFSEKPEPTIKDSKLSITASDGVFDITADGLKPGVNYYFRAYLQTTDKVYYSNQLESSGIYDKRWTRQDDIPETFKYFTGLLFKDIYDNLVIFNVQDETKSIVPYYNLDYDFLKGNYQTKTWFESPTFNIKMLTGVREMIILNPNKDRIFIGGGFQINNNLPSSKVYSNRLWFFSDPSNYGGELTVPMPTEFEAKSFSVGNNMFVLESRNGGRLWDFTNLEWQAKKNHTFQNLGRILATGTQQRGFVISESTSTSSKGGILYEYNPSSDIWITKSPFIGEERNDGIMFSVKNKIYYGLGKSKLTKRILKDIWEYDPQNETWKQIGFYPGNGNVALIQTVIGNEVYLGMGYQTFINANNGLEFSGVRDFWILQL